MRISAIFDRIFVDILFDKNERGETVFYPHGLLGRAYVLPAAREAATRDALRRFMLISLLCGMSYSLLIARIQDSAGPMTTAGWIVAGTLFVLMIGTLAVFQSRLAKGLEPSWPAPPQRK
jgi:hypothetical protein